MMPLLPLTLSRDAVTGLPGPGVFADRIDAALGGRRGGDRGIALLKVELGAVAEVRASQGHVAGDLMLRHAAMRLLEVTRAEDVATRLGTGSFGIGLIGVPDAAQAARVCARLLRGLAEPFDLPGGVVGAGARIGATFTDGDRQDGDALADQAEQALTRARADAPGSFAFFDPALDAEIGRVRRLEQDLPGAVDRGELALQFQPQIDVRTRRVVGAEALLRWHHPSLGRISPDIFIPMAEDQGEMVRIGAWVLEQACSLGATFSRPLATPFGVSVNLSPLQLRTSNFPARVGETLARSGFPPERLTLEITERMLVRNTAESLRVLAELACLGVKLSMDDFGLGHSSLAYLLQFAFDEIKVDRSFVAGADRNATSAAIVRATVGLARDLGLASTAEGVETEAQFALLEELGCTAAQGHLFSAPLDPAELASMLHAAAPDPVPLQYDQRSA